MEISRTPFGFVEVLDHPIIDNIEFTYAGICNISYRNGATRTLDMESDIYNSQYGIPVSNDGTMLFRSDWENGIYAISAENGVVIWCFRQRRIRRRR